MKQEWKRGTTLVLNSTALLCYSGFEWKIMRGCVRIIDDCISFSFIFFTVSIPMSSHPQYSVLLPTYACDGVIDVSDTTSVRTCRCVYT